MAYDSQMVALSRGAVALHSPLQAVVFLEANKNSILVFSDGTQLPVQHRSHGYDLRREAYAIRVAAELGGTDPFSLLTFGYSGTGPRCYSVFLQTAGFKDANVEDIRTPLLLKADGAKLGGEVRKAKRSAEITGKSLDEVREKASRTGDEMCLLHEEVLCDGAEATKSLVVNSDSPDEARKRASREAPSGAEVLGMDVVAATAHETSRLEAFAEEDASAKAGSQIKRHEAGYKSIATVACVRSPRKGLLGIGKRVGQYEVTFAIEQQRATIRYRPLAKVKVTYGSSKLLCNSCHQPMGETKDGVHYAGAAPSPDSAIVKLRCEKCDITRFEKRYEIDGEWIEWQDGSRTVL